jgi:hypothetical protein
VIQNYLFGHCERGGAIQSSVPHDGYWNKLTAAANIHRPDSGTEDWIALSLRSSQ